MIDPFARRAYRSIHLITRPEVPRNVRQITPILNVSNMAENFAWFEKLGWKKLWDWGDPPTEPWCVREFHLRHPDGHTFRIGAGIGQ